MCLPPRFETLRLVIIRGGLKQFTPNQVLGDVMTQETYRMEREGVDKDEKKEDEDQKKKSIAFKASSSSKNKGKSKKQESSDNEDASNIDDEAMALSVRKFGTTSNLSCHAKCLHQHPLERTTSTCNYPIMQSVHINIELTRHYVFIQAIHLSKPHHLLTYIMIFIQSYYLYILYFQTLLAIYLAL
jgi:hypothetical protein